jgi:hypothetical protein
VGNPVYYSPVHETKIEDNTLILAGTNKFRNKSISWLKIEDCFIYEIDWDGNLTYFKWQDIEHFNEFGFDRISKLEYSSYLEGRDGYI